MLPTLQSIAAVLDWFGLVVFATTGALVASRKGMDVFGFALLATVTGVGGGTLRDVTLGILPVFWVQRPAYLIVCVVVACLLFFTAHIPQSRLKLLIWLDAIGLALFAVTGAEIALATGVAPIVAIAMGVITATFGGIIRDVLGGETPLVLSQEIYVTAALAGALVFVAALSLKAPKEWALLGGFACAFVVRAAAILRGWSLPRYKPRPGR